MAKGFFYVCAGLFLLALSYQCGAQRAQAQAGQSITCANAAGPVAIVGRNMVYLPGTSPPSAPVPGSDAIVSCAPGTAFSGPRVVVANGDVYEWNEPLAWALKGNLLGGVTAARSTSFGALKAKYR